MDNRSTVFSVRVTPEVATALDDVVRSGESRNQVIQAGIFSELQRRGVDVSRLNRVEVHPRYFSKSA